MSIKRAALRISIWLVATLLILTTCDYQTEFPKELIIVAIVGLLWIGGSLDFAYSKDKRKERL